MLNSGKSKNTRLYCQFLFDKSVHNQETTDMIKLKLVGMTVAFASVLALTSSAMAAETYDRQQSERTFADYQASVGATHQVDGRTSDIAFATAYASAQHVGNRSDRPHNERMRAAPGLAATWGEQSAIDRLAGGQS
jgi:hypothetical protein